MGTIKQGILGGFSGKVGTVVGSSWKGISYMRGQAQSVKNPRTAKQMAQRDKFSLARPADGNSEAKRQRSDLSLMG